MTKTASVIYWYPELDCPRDGGGSRALAWVEALRSLGYETVIAPIHPSPPTTDRPSRLSHLKRLAAPMPLSRPFTVPDTDVVVATVPGIFGSVGRQAPHKVIFDWMDVWSINSWTMGRSSPWAVPGGSMQSLVWYLREPRLARSAAVNTFAGFSDFGRLGAEQDLWLPSPAIHDDVPPRDARPVHTVGFLGNLLYEPNEFSLRWFLRSYEERFTKAGIEICIAGYGSERVRDWNTRARVLGTVTNLEDFYGQIDASIVPIKHGGGHKVKALEALARGVPVICTPEVLRGFPVELVAPGTTLLDDYLLDPSVALSVANLDELRDCFSFDRFRNRVKSAVDAVDG